jgi:hypothetical protein
MHQVGFIARKFRDVRSAKYKISIACIDFKTIVVNGPNDTS